MKEDRLLWAVTNPGEHETLTLAALAAQDENPECPMCSGPGVELGTLGQCTHYRCRNCGTVYHEEA